MKKAIITGITGQDGSYLAKLLLDKGYKVYGAQRRNTGLKHWRLDELGITDQIEFANVVLLNKVDLLNKEEISNLHGVLYHINPNAKIYETTKSNVPLKAVLNTNLFNFKEAKNN